MRVLIVIILAANLSSCNFVSNLFGGKEKPLARVYDEYLYPSDLLNIVPDAVASNDSAILVQSYIENWIRQKVILNQALENGNINKTEVEEQLNNYRNSLIIYSYEQQLVSQKLDTNVSEKQIVDFYNKNKENFELKKSIVKLKYIKIPKSANQLSLARKWFQSSKPKDASELETYCIQFASEYSLVDTNWIYTDELNSIIPIRKFSEDDVLQKNTFFDFADNEFIYLLKIKDFMYREDTSPIEFEMDNIKNGIINKRKLELINAMENNVYKKALEEKDIELYKSK